MNLLAMSFWEYLQSNLLLTIILGALLALIVIVSIALAVTVKKSKKRKRNPDKTGLVASANIKQVRELLNLR